MAELRKILVSVPLNLLNEVDKIALADKTTRSELVREAMKLYVTERRRSDIARQMKAGYQEMAEINRRLAEYCLEAENEAMQKIESLFKELD